MLGMETGLPLDLEKGFARPKSEVRNPAAVRKWVFDMPAMTMADLKDLMPQAERYFHDRNVHAEGLQKIIAPLHLVTNNKIPILVQCQAHAASSVAGLVQAMFRRPCRSKRS